jgi:apolipoprotein N-acyltransferase
MLCWEVLFYASPLRWFSGSGWGWVDVIFNLTNDVWFGTRWGKERHFWYSVLVARSLSATLVRSSNFGISGVYTVSGMYKLKDEGEGFLFFSF